MISVRQYPLSKLTDPYQIFNSLCFTCSTRDGVAYWFPCYCILITVLPASVSAWWVETYFSLHSKTIIASCMAKLYNVFLCRKWVLWCLIFYCLWTNYRAITKIIITESRDLVSLQFLLQRLAFHFYPKERYMSKRFPFDVLDILFSKELKTLNNIDNVQIQSIAETFERRVRCVCLEWFLTLKQQKYNHGPKLEGKDRIFHTMAWFF